jgi:hypothetical protein
MGADAEETADLQHREERAIARHDEVVDGADFSFFSFVTLLPVSLERR